MFSFISIFFHCINHAKIRIFLDPFFCIRTASTILSLNGKVRVKENRNFGIFNAMFPAFCSTFQRQSDTRDLRVIARDHKLICFLQMINFYTPIKRCKNEILEWNGLNQSVSAKKENGKMGKCKKTTSKCTSAGKHFETLILERCAPLQIFPTHQYLLISWSRTQVFLKNPTT